MQTPVSRPSGLPYAIGVYAIWGILPLYFRFLEAVPPFEQIGWRVVFTLPVCIALLIIARQHSTLRRALTSRVTMMSLTASSLLIGGNWLIYVTAIATDRVLAASLGFYINPLLNVLAGTIFLKEKLSPWQWLAVGLAGLGVGVLAFGALDALWISLGLGVTFCGYGLVKKLAPVEATAGLTIESCLLILPAIGLIYWQSTQPGGISLGKSTVDDIALACAGIFTGLPLLLFTVAARRMSYSALGFVQFITPTIVFMLGLFVFKEPLNTVQLASFVIIWTAIAVFCWDLLRDRRVPKA